MTPRKDIAGSLVLILFSLTFLIYTTRYPLDNWESPGPAVFPLLLGAVLLLLAAILIREWVNLPSWVLWVAIAVWFAKDLLFFAFVWRAYDRSPRGAAEMMVGTQGIAEERLNPAGYVRI